MISECENVCHGERVDRGLCPVTQHLRGCVTFYQTSSSTNFELPLARPYVSATAIERHMQNTLKITLKMSAFMFIFIHPPYLQCLFLLVNLYVPVKLYLYIHRSNLLSSAVNQCFSICIWICSFFYWINIIFVIKLHLCESKITWAKRGLLSGPRLNLG